PVRAHRKADRLSSRTRHQPGSPAGAGGPAHRRRASRPRGPAWRHPALRLPSAPPQGRAVQPSRELLPAPGGEARVGPAARAPQIVLKELKVRDLALVAESRVRFGPGLNLLTGETGSGKSLIVDALGLTLGARGGADQVRHGAARATVEGTFESGGSALVLERELGKRSSARIDGRAANPTQLRELGRNLVAVHGQHEHHARLDNDTQ